MVPRRVASTVAVDRRPRLLAIGSSRGATGCARVLHALTHRLTSRFAVDLLGLRPQQDRGPVPAGPHFHRAECGNGALEHQGADLEAELRPDLVLICAPPWLAAGLLRRLRAQRPDLPIALYTSVEGRLNAAEALSPLTDVDLCLTFTHYARAQIEAKVDELGIARRPSVAVLPHGVDRASFFPLQGVAESRMQAKREVFPDLRDIEASFLVLNANAPYERKRLDLTIEGFARFARDKPPGVRLCLHQATADRQDRRRIRSWIRAAGIESRTDYQDFGVRGAGLSDEGLNRLYNACDVGLNTAMGEGWGLLSFEHAATGVAQIVPGHTSFLENWEGAAELLPPVDVVPLAHECCEMFPTSSLHVAAALERLYADRGHRLELAEAAYRRATDSRLSWDVIGDQLSSRLHGLLQGEGVSETGGSVPV